MQSNGSKPGAQAPGVSLERDEQTAMDDVVEADDLDVKLDERTQALIGQHLKAVYGEIVRQPVPDQFLRLLDELERKEKEQ